MYEILFSERQVGNHTIKNRIVFSSPTTGFSHDGQPTARLMAYYLERAKGGAGLIELEPGLKYRENRRAEWSELTEQIHAYGAKLAATLENEIDPDELSVIKQAGFDGVSLRIESNAKIPKLLSRFTEMCGDLLVGLHVREGDPSAGFGANYVILLGDSPYAQSAVQTAVAKSVDYSDPESCESLLKQGSADLIALSDQLVCDPFWPAKAELGKDDAIRWYNLLNEGNSTTGLIRCALNPYLGQEGTYSESAMPFAAQTKIIVVVGGGPAGMQAAITASKRGHNVFLLEETNELGGRLLSQNRGAAEWMVSELKRNHVDVRIGLPVTTEHIAALGPEAVVMALGDSPSKKDLIPSLQKRKISVTDINVSGGSIGQAIRSGYQVAIGL